MANPAIKKARDMTPDVARGFALWGIIIVNVAYLSTSVTNGITGESITGTADGVAAFLVQTFALGKFYLLFSFLFGYSAQYVMKDTLGGRQRWTLRNVGLVVLGVLHASLLFSGDILFLYGILGMLLIVFVGRSDRSIRAWAQWIFGFMVVLCTSLAALTWAGELSGQTVQASAVHGYEEVVRSGTYLESIPARFDLWISEQVFFVLFQGPFTFVAFLLGVLASRSALLGATHGASRARQLMGWGLGLGLPLQFAAAAVWLANEVSATPSEAVSLSAFFFSFLTAPLLTAGYIGALVWVVNRAPRSVSLMAYPGRMSLTVYLSQSAILSLIFGAWGFGQYQALPYWVNVLIALGVAAALTLVARVWLNFFSQGPGEFALAWFSKLGAPRQPTLR
jgi:uncharacterized protein